MKKLLVQFNLPASDSTPLQQTMAKSLAAYLADKSPVDWRKIVVPVHLIVELRNEDADRLCADGSMQLELCRYIRTEVGQKVQSVEISEYEEL